MGMMPLRPALSVELGGPLFARRNHGCKGYIEGTRNLLVVNAIRHELGASGA
jgi:hypothetical protein